MSASGQKQTLARVAYNQGISVRFRAESRRSAKAPQERSLRSAYGCDFNRSMQRFVQNSSLSENTLNQKHS